MKVDTGQDPPHQGCKAGSCCSPAKLWRSLQTLIKANDRKGLIAFFKDPRQEHILRVALTHRVPNDPMLLPASHRHQLIRYAHPEEAYPILGKSLTDLNSLQLALLTSSESMVMTLLGQLRLYCKKELKASLSHVYGSGNTSLHLAVFLQRSRVVKALLELGASPLAVNQQALSVLDCCRHRPAMASFFSPPKESVTIERPTLPVPEQTFSLGLTTPCLKPATAYSSLIYSTLIYSTLIYSTLMYSTVHYFQWVLLPQPKKPPDLASTLLSLAF
ncbi:hypothetical protein BY458DRAFT_446692 [Sporodiniella umbellata]|nr:hypothetical protein BY458DRAFT_446692 [Sporodiniella umbellata]